MADGPGSVAGFAKGERLVGEELVVLADLDILDALEIGPVAFGSGLAG